MTDQHRARHPGGSRQAASRANPRVGADIPVDLYAGDFPGALPGRARDVGIGGLCIATASPFAFKSVHRVRLFLPGTHLDVEAEGRWQRNASGEDMVLTGVAFVRPPPEIVNLLWDLVLESAKQLARFLHAGSDLSDLGLDEAMGLAQLTRYREVPRGRLVYREDRIEAGEDSFFVVARGAIVLEARVRGARNVPFDRLGVGALFGGLPLLADVPPSETAVADQDSRLLEIDRQAYEHLATVKPRVAQRLAYLASRAGARRARELLLRARNEL